MNLNLLGHLLRLRYRLKVQNSTRLQAFFAKPFVEDAAGTVVFDARSTGF